MKYRILIAALVLCSVFVPGLIFPGIGLSAARAQTCPTCPQNNPDFKPLTFPTLSLTSPEPVSFTTGAFVSSFTDIAEHGVMPIVFTRYHDSTMGYDGPIGHNWDFSFNRYLSFASGVTYYHTGQGVKIALQYPHNAISNSSGAIVLSPGWGHTSTGATIIAKSTTRDFYLLTSNSPPLYVINAGGDISVQYYQYVVTDKYGNQDVFDVNGFLIGSIDRNGNELTYTRDTNGNLLSIQDPVHGQSLTLTLDSHYHITAITDSSGRTVSYSYDSNYDLTGVTSPETVDFPDGVTDNYTYDSDQRMITKADGSGNTVITNTYGGIGSPDEFRVVSQVYQGHTQTYSYDDTDQKTTYTDNKGFVTDYSWDANGDITKIVVHNVGIHSGAPSTYETDFQYDSLFRRTETIYPNGNSASWTYDGVANVLTAKVSMPSGAAVNSAEGSQVLSATTTWTYESRFNQVASITDAKGNVTTYNYGTDARGNVQSITYPTTAAGTASESFTYNGVGQVLTDTAPDGTVTQNTYDGSTSYLSQTVKDYGSSKLNATTQFTYDSYGHVATIKDPNGNTTVISTNALDQVSEIDGASGEVEQKSYDANGNLITDQKQAPGGGWQKTVNVYNSYQQPTATRKYTGASAYLETDFAYDASGNLITVTDPLGHSVTTAYDERNKPYLVTDALGNTVKYDFDGNGHTIKLTDELNHVTTYAYDGLDQLEQKTFPDSSYQTWSYDSVGNVTGLRTTAGSFITQTFDTRNRMLTQNYGSTITNSYDIMGRLLTASEGGTSITYAYDDLGRKTSFTDQAGLASTYTYDLDGHRLNSTYPTSITVKRAYDASNRVLTLKDGSNTTVATFSYDILDRATGISLANSTSVSDGYDLLNRVNYVDNTLGTGNRNYGYVYDDANRITSTSEPRGTIASSYSNRNELAGITEPSGSPFADQSFVYDAGFNRSSWTLGTTTTGYTANNLNQYSAVGSATPTWNTDGGLYSFAGNTYAYDALQRLTEVDYSGGKTLFAYDPFGRRVKKVDENSGGTVLSTFQYHYDGNEVAVEYQPSTTWTYYLGIGLDQVVMRDSGSAKQWYYRDGHGGTSAVADNSGNVLEQYEYTAQGHFQITNASGTVISGTGIANDILYAGRNYDYETGNYFFRARYFNPVLGRFISRDPLSGAEFSQGTNLYAYTSNNYLNLNDPLGLAPITYTGGAAIGVGAQISVTTDGNGNVTGASFSVGVGGGFVATSSESTAPEAESDSVSVGLTGNAGTEAVEGGDVSSDFSAMTSSTQGVVVTSGADVGAGPGSLGFESSVGYSAAGGANPLGSGNTATQGWSAGGFFGAKVQDSWGSSSTTPGTDPNGGNNNNAGPRNIPSDPSSNSNSSDNSNSNNSDPNSPLQFNLNAS
jgi:RHS repeat-associated protein